MLSVFFMFSFFTFFYKCLDLLCSVLILFQFLYLVFVVVDIGVVVIVVV